MGARASHKYPLSRKEEMEAFDMLMDMVRNHASRAIHQASNSSALSAATESSKRPINDRHKTLFFSLRCSVKHYLSFGLSNTSCASTMVNLCLSYRDT